MTAETQFHDFLVKRSGNVELAALLERTSLLTTFFGLPMPSAIRPPPAPELRLHERLVAVLRRRDPDEAERAMRSHTGIYSRLEAER